MATGRNHKYQKKSSKYKYVAKKICERGVELWIATYKCTITFATEREAAIFVDKKLIAEGKEPLNILTRA
jgi:hypothetical protein